MKRTDILILSISLGVCIFAGIIGSYFTIPSINTWYSTLTKPVFTPPDWIFGLTWVILYLLMGVSLFLVWRLIYAKKKTKKVKADIQDATEVFIIQLIFNIWWPVIFFGLKSPFTGFVVLIFLLIFALMTSFKFYKINRISAYLLIPYVLWVTFASMLNLGIIILN